jgi:hypothetical protein
MYNKSVKKNGSTPSLYGGVPDAQGIEITSH